jgi:alpha-tubulin suppressor-like RCC1 family protein
VLTQIGVRGDWVQVAAGRDHSLAIARDGTLWAWGAAVSGQPGAAEHSTVDAPQRVGEDEDWVSIAASEACSAGLKRNGSLWAWGWDRRGLPGVSRAPFDMQPRRLA